ncbi:MAG: HvfX family Cu-binding RiPP maturation protein [Gammaproteobacteria bacterium]
MNLLNKMQGMMDATRALDFLGPLALRLYLVPIFWMAGTGKISGFENTVNYFGNPDWGLGMPFPTLMVALALSAEVLGAIMLLIGLGVRWICVPLMVTMLVAAFSAHWQNGWQAIADVKFCLFNCADAQAAADRLSRAKSILKENGDYGWLTEQGSFVVLNNGIEFAATYFIMLLALFFIGGGRYVSLDYWIAQKWGRQAGLQTA